jgi:excisionase family DNA binding protein
LSIEGPQYSETRTSASERLQGGLAGARAGSIGRANDQDLLTVSKKKMIMTLEARDKLMSLTDVSEMLGIPVHTLYRWRYKGHGPAGYRVGRHVRYRREAVEAWLEQRADERR